MQPAQAVRLTAGSDYPPPPFPSRANPKQNPVPLWSLGTSHPAQVPLQTSLSNHPRKVQRCCGVLFPSSLPLSVQAVAFRAKEEGSDAPLRSSGLSGARTSFIWAPRGRPAAERHQFATSRTSGEKRREQDGSADAQVSLSSSFLCETSARRARAAGARAAPLRSRLELRVLPRAARTRPFPKGASDL